MNSATKENTRFKATNTLEPETQALTVKLAKPCRTLC